MSQNLSLTQAKIDLISEILTNLKSVEYEDNPTKTYLEGRETENDRCAVLLQQKKMALLDLSYQEKTRGLERFPLLFAKHFPPTHKKAGKETNFARKIRTGQKIHTLRRDYAYWSAAVRKVQEGEGYISLTEWEQNKTETQSEILFLDASCKIGLQKVRYSKGKFYLNRVRLCVDQLASNDGMLTSDFLRFFKTYGHSELALIHFTDFRY
ncbi:hypothetical protein ACE193_21375 [Bernardetia sp. OM2101]|uniref:hypothetical protein n=1 Tax=Bernardetia sp. OM2101 TaxID=3344876 RepID=UPI0035CEAAA3